MPSESTTQRMADVELADAAERIGALVANVERVVLGKRHPISLTVLALLAEGHVLLEDVPGVGKTALAKALAASVAATNRRVQFTPDLLPADITGSQVLNRRTNEFVFRPGPVFANIMLADEINRSPAKTQSALLEAMEERQITNDTQTFRLPRPFMVIATQNPFEHSGTYTLPESQLDRFMFRISIGYPDRSTEIEVMDRDGAERAIPRLEEVLSLDEVRALIGCARQIHTAPSVQAYVVDLVHQTRRHPSLRLGASPRAGLALLRATRARALSRGRPFVSPDDVVALVAPVLGHRLQLRSGEPADIEQAAEVLDEVISSVPVPGTRPRR